MPAPQHLRLEFRGVFGTALAPQEQWSFSINHDDGLELVTAADFSSAATDISTAYANNINSIMPSNVSLTMCRVSRISGGDNGIAAGRVRKRPDGSFEQGDDNTVRVGTQGPINAPPQLAVAVSLVTARAGATGKGRFFLPMPAFVPSLDDRRLTEADSNAIAAGAKNLLNDLNGLVGIGSCVVASSKGYLSPVTGVRVGRAVDTIRSRRGQLAEGYAVRTL